LSGASLSGAYLIKMDLSRVNLNVNQLSVLKSLYGCENLHDSLKHPLQQSHPQLFQEPFQEGEE
jgi:hypothetical protein